MKRKNRVDKAKISDIFFSMQGEGVYARSPQIFVRFYDCQCSCRFCDTRLISYDKYSPGQLYHKVKRLIHGLGAGGGLVQACHSLCITGGEPLLQASFLKKFLRLIKNEGIATYLETNGILADELALLIEDIDIVAMDFKLPSSTGMGDYWPEHRRFLKAALKSKVFIKMVICLSTQRKDITQAIDLIVKLNVKEIPVVLQPNFFELSKELLDKTRALQKYCARYLADTKVIPQLHKLTGVK